MHTAIYQERIISLPSFKREDYQKLFEEGKRGKLTCPSCHQHVQLYLGIHHEPYFYHQIPSSCEGPSLPEEQKEESSYIERDGFRYPTRKTIVQSEETPWKQHSTPKRIKPLIKKKTTARTLQIGKKEISLSPSQYDAVTHVEGPLLVLAGAGSGKTRVLTVRTAYMIHTCQISPRELFLVTFTSKAAQEMKTRIQQLLQGAQQHLNGMVIGTFHSIFYKILLHHDRERWLPEKLLKYDWQKEKIIKGIGLKHEIDEKEFPYDQALQQIGYWKNTLIFPKDLHSADAFEQKATLLYKEYEQYKETHGIFDFDDMLIGCYQLFLNNPEILERYQQRFRHFLIDEFQDINPIQYKIIQMLCKKSNNICVVGDDDQAIYSFRGSNPSFILDFKSVYPKTKTITLKDNYRSTHEIVSLANQVIMKNENRHQKEMIAQHTVPHKPILFFPYDEEEEATMIVTDIQEKLQQGASPKEFTILYRTNVAARAIFERLSQAGIPFSVERDQDSFYERRIVRMLLAFLRLSFNEDDVASLNTIFPALFLKQKSLQELKAISILEDCTLIDGLKKLSGLKPFQVKKLAKTTSILKKLKKASPVVAIEMIEKEMGFTDYVKKRGSEGNKLERSSDDIRDLKVIAKKFDHVTDFLDYTDHMIGQLKEKKNAPVLENGIQLLTVHRSKGLENKFIYVLGVVDGSMPHDFALESYRSGEQESLEEERRLLYVAITRAQDYLYLSVPQTRRGRTSYPSRFIRHLY